MHPHLFIFAVASECFQFSALTRHYVQGQSVTCNKKSCEKLRLLVYWELVTHVIIYLLSTISILLFYLSHHRDRGEEAKRSFAGGEQSIKTCAA